jgi:hypothetical protein
MPIIALAGTLHYSLRYKIFPGKEVGIEDQGTGIGNH